MCACVCETPRSVQVSPVLKRGRHPFGFSIPSSTKLRYRTADTSLADKPFGRSVQLLLGALTSHDTWIVLKQFSNPSELFNVRYVTCGGVPIRSGVTTMAKGYTLPEDSNSEASGSSHTQNVNVVARQVLQATLLNMPLNAIPRQIEYHAVPVQPSTVASTGQTAAATSSAAQGVARITGQPHAVVYDAQGGRVERRASPSPRERSSFTRSLDILVPTRKSWYPSELALMVQRVYYFSKGNSNYKEDMCSSPSELCGYSVRLGLGCWKDETKRIVLMFFLQLCQGPKDASLEWPFCTPFTFKIVHPTDSRDNVQQSVGAREMARVPASFAMPRSSRHNARFELGDTLSVTELARKGLWQERTLQVSVEAL